MPDKAANLWVNKEVTKRIVRRFQLEEQQREPGNPLFIPVVLPTTNIDILLRVAKVAHSIQNLTAAAGTYKVYHTVPTGKRWEVIRFQRDDTNVATPMSMVQGGLQLLIKAASTTLAPDSLVLHMEAGDTLGLNTTGNVGDAAISLNLHFFEEDAY